GGKRPGQRRRGRLQLHRPPGFATPGQGRLQGTVHGGVAVSSDPLVTLPVPPAPAATFAAVAYSGSDPLILSPGTYVGGIWLSGQGPVTLLPGLYYLHGGGFSVSGQARVTGDRVTLDNAPRRHSDAISLTAG